MLQDEVSRPATEGLIWTFVALSSLFMAARLYTRLRIVNKIGLDDYIMCVSLICAYIFAALVSTAISWGMGLHADQLNDEQSEKALLYNAASFAPGILSFTVPKLGVTALLIRILNPTPRTTLALWIFVGAVVLLNFGCVIILFAQCRPARALWVQALQGQEGTRCWSYNILADYSIVTGALSSFVDLFLAVYPATVLWKLQMNRKKKIGLSVILGMGVFACAVSIYKTTRLTDLDSGPDYIYRSFSVFLWTGIEANTIIIAACIPTIAPLLESIFGRRVFYNGSSAPSSIEPTYCVVCKRFISRRTNKNSNNNHHANSNSNSNSQKKKRKQKQFFKSPTQSASITVSHSNDHHCQECSGTHNHSNPNPHNNSNSNNNTHRKKTKNHISSSRSDVESQTSILDSDDDAFEREHDENSIPMDHIARRDEFTIAYERRASIAAGYGVRRPNAVLRPWSLVSNYNHGHADHGSGPGPGL